VTLQELIRLEAVVHDLSVPLAIPIFSFTYSVGWIMNFVSDWLFNTKFLKLACDSSAYENARMTVLQHGSSALVRDLLIDRHIIRLGRAGVVNFALLAIGFLLYAFKGGPQAFPIAILSVALAVGCYNQWEIKHRAHHARMIRSANMLHGELSSKAPQDDKSRAAHG
jgi:hypothetical protein